MLWTNCPTLTGIGALITVPSKRAFRRQPVMPRVVRLVRVPKANVARKQRPRRSRNRGDFAVRAPAAVGRVVRGVGTDRVPIMSSRGRNIRITHTERFTPVTTTGTGLEVRTFAINPGLANVFPWCCDVANRFEKYKFQKLSFRYVASSSTGAGGVTLAFDFDPNDEAPTTMEQATRFHDYVSSSIWQPFVLTPDLANGDRLPQKNTRPGMPSTDVDLNVYDVGQLHILTEGAAAATLGYVEVIYVVDLFIHQVQNEVGGDVKSTAGLDGTHMVGSDPTTYPHAVLPVEFTSTSVMTFTQPWEGVFVAWQAGVGLSVDYDPHISATGTATQLRQTGTSTSVMSLYRIKAVRGTTLTPTITMATSMSKSAVVFGGGGYDQYSFT